MASPGLLMRLVEPQLGAPLSDSVLAPQDLVPSSSKIYRMEATDSNSPRFCTLYWVHDITVLLENPSLHEADVRSNKDNLCSIAWVVLSFISGRDPKSTSPSQDHMPRTSPRLGSIIVANGSTPRSDKEDDYNAWYDEEHGNKLTSVPGWQMMRRYKLAKVFGDAEVAKFYGVNFYDEVNGLGGPEWKASVTDWTLRIRDQAAKPNIRRTWKLVQVC